MALVLQKKRRYTVVDDSFLFHGRSLVTNLDNPDPFAFPSVPVFAHRGIDHFAENKCHSSWWEG